MEFSLISKQPTQSAPNRADRLLTIIMHRRASFSSQSSRIFSPLSRRLTRLLCFFLILSLLQWSSEIEKHHGSSSARWKASSGIAVFAFQQRQHVRRWQRQPIESICHSLSSQSVSWRHTSLFFSSRDNEISSMKNRRRYLGKNHCTTQRCSSRKPLFGSGLNASTNDGGESGGGSSNESPSNGNKKKRLFSMKRIGGRKRRQSRSRGDANTANKISSSSPPAASIESNKNRPSAGFLVVALLVLTLLKNLVFGGGSDSDYYYYSYSSSSSSVYETRINPDGSQTTTETSRKENSDLKTNIPGLKTNSRDVIKDRGNTNYNTFYFDE